MVLTTSSSVPTSTWTYDGRTWTLQHPAISPTNIGFGPIAYDPILAEIVMVSSLQMAEGKPSWTYDGKTWTQRAAAPFSSEDFSMDYDPTIRQIVIFGGQLSYSSYTYKDETFAFDGSRWTTLQPHWSPSPRSGASMTYDPAIGHLLLFGGRAGQSMTAVQRATTRATPGRSRSPAERIRTSRLSPDDD
jgi:hypothetical protein